MEHYIVKGGNSLSGEVEIAGAKNAALAILAASIMTNETVTIDNVPDVGKVTLNIEIKNSEIVDIEDVNTSNSVDINSMKTEDLFKLYTNLTKMKIYPYIAPYLGL